MKSVGWLASCRSFTGSVRMDGLVECENLGSEFSKPLPEDDSFVHLSVAQHGGP